MVDCPAGAVSELSDAMQQGQAVESGASDVWEELTVLKVGPPCYGGLPQVAYNPWLEPGDPQHFLLPVDHPWETPVVLLSHQRAAILLSVFCAALVLHCVVVNPWNRSVLQIVHWDVFY